MWRRIYLVLLLVRLYFALAPSYLHPDENFQGPEVIAGRVFSYSVHLTWEFTSVRPIRSVFPLWPVYGLPMLLLRWVWVGNGSNGEVAPYVVYWTLRLLMFALSFVMEDWAIHELVPSPRHRRVAVLLTASSYVTWTLQTHTFSNSVETLLVVWSMVLIQRILENKRLSSVFTSGILGLFIVFGTFNRITFPAFIAIPGIRLVPHFRRRPSALLSLLASSTLFTILAISFDTQFYAKEPITYSTLLNMPVITPLNNLFYNLETKNLAQHGLHPYYQHIVANLPQLLGPASLLLLTIPKFTPPLISAISGIAVLSLFQHQEARFLLPAIPLILSSVRLPQRFTRLWLAAWVVFNVAMGILMGMYHQGGVIPTQLYLASKEDATQAFWWRTYSPPIWLLNGESDRLRTTDLMGLQPDAMIATLSNAATCWNQKNDTKVGTYLVAPRSSTFLDQYTGGQPKTDLALEEVWTYKNHLNLDDLNFAEDGILATIKRVIGRRGLTTWRVFKFCVSPLPSS